jgi:hypothetical protein
MFTPNFVPTGQVWEYEDFLNSIEVAYGGFNAGGNMKAATLGALNVLTVSSNPMLLTGSNLGFSGLQYTVKFQKPLAASSGAGIGAWETITSFAFTPGLGGTTLDLKDHLPAISTSRQRGPINRITGGTFDGSDDLQVTNLDGSQSTPIAIPAGSAWIVDNGDGTATIG